MENPVVLTKAERDAIRTDDREWATERLRDMQSNAEFNASRHGDRLVKGHGFPNLVMLNAQDALALRIVLATCDAQEAQIAQLTAERDTARAARTEAEFAAFEAERRVHALEAEAARLRTDAAALIAKLDAAIPVIDGQIALQFVRTGHQYTGPTFGVELEALRAALTPPASGKATGA